MGFLQQGSFPASLKPAQERMALSTNYLSFTDGSGKNFSQQYLPELYEAEVERYGNRTIGGFLRMVGAEMPMTSDQVVWSEQNRLHIAYPVANVTDTALGGNNVDIEVTIDLSASQVAGKPTKGAVRVGQTILMADNATKLVVEKGLVQKVSGTNDEKLDVKLYGTATTAYGSNESINLYVYGADFGKGSIGMEGSIEPTFTQYSNNPMILKDNFQINGSDTAQIGWVEVSTEDGQSGYLWYLKAESETRLRFEDYLEMSMVEGEKNAGINAVTTAKLAGTEGLFAAIEDRGNVQVGFTAAAGIDDFDGILKNLDTQGAIEENMLFLQRQTALDFDDMLAAISGGAAGGTAFGLFENSEEMALNLGFSGFRRGSYDFYKTDWKYLNDASTRGAISGINSIEGVLIPAGTSTVYDQVLGTNIRRPFLHVRYRASQADDRRMKSWLTGSAGGAFTSTLDAMEVNFLSERCLVTQAANNFVLFKGV